MKSLKKIFVYSVLSLPIFIVLFTSCQPGNKNKTGQNKAFEIHSFSAITNYLPQQQGVKSIYLDYTDALDGFVIPSLTQVDGGNFAFSFKLQNNTNTNQELYYKIFYQNESYKFQEYDSITRSQHPLAAENFYGSWNDTEITFKKITLPASTKELQINDVFNIVGNPRNESKYFDNDKNCRWKRNPRVGKYSFLLVVCTKNDWEHLPLAVKNISLKQDSTFVNPFYYFKHTKPGINTETHCVVDSLGLMVIAKPNLGTGIYVNASSFNGASYDKSYFCNTCGDDSNLFRNAPLQQFINYVDASTKFNNIPVLADILKDNYSLTEYNWNKSFTAQEELVPTLIQTTKKPCQTVFSDPQNSKVIIKNPATKYGEWKKESVGVITRHGLTYGKYRVKVKLTELLNKEGVWNGLTNAIWLITQGGGEWNYRRICHSNKPYMSTYWGGVHDKRVPAVDYSEIDFEIIKTPPYCPDNIFSPVYKVSSANNKNVNNWNTTMPFEIKESKGKLTVACTNWDMACMEPENFTTGCNSISYGGQSFYTFRWDSAYRALTERSEEFDDKLFGGPWYYFEIDWRPKEIIWRIGDSPQNMRIVGYMNDKVTNVPNNQMLLIITQEYHNTVWWPGAPFAQNNLPFPLNDIPGEIYEIQIE